MKTSLIRRLHSRDKDFAERFAALRRRGALPGGDVETAVLEIINQVRQRGDAALREYTERFDRFRTDSFELPKEKLEAARNVAPSDAVATLASAAERIRVYHERQKIESWRYTDADGVLLGQKVTPLERVGVYAPGGKASYPSSVLMNIIPAKVAGVEEVVLAVPAPDGRIDDLVLAAADLAGADRVFAMGGAQAVAALAYGTETVPRVDKIVGPGNQYVAVAKRLVYGQVDIDMIAGPSEILIIADGAAQAKWTAMDLCAQAEHDEEAQSILLSLDEKYTDAVEEELKKLCDSLQRKEIVRAALAKHGALITVQNIDEAIDLANQLAPEHLQLSLAESLSIAERIKHAGAIFLGAYTPEALGDYCAGPNHVLPTSGSARFFSPLGVYDFQKRSSLIGCDARNADKLARVSERLARSEGLEAHALSAAYRKHGA